MKIKSIAEHSAILSIFIKLQFVIKIFVMSILEWPFYTGFTVFIMKGGGKYAETYLSVHLYCPRCESTHSQL